MKNIISGIRDQACHHALICYKEKLGQRMPEESPQRQPEES